MSQVDLASTDDYRYAGAETLSFRHPVFVNTAKRPRVDDGETDQHDISPDMSACTNTYIILRPSPDSHFCTVQNGTQTRGGG